MEPIRRRHYCYAALGGKQHSDGGFRHFYYCKDEDCPYALCAVVARPDTDSGERAIRLYARGTHDHQEDELTEEGLSRKSFYYELCSLRILKHPTRFQASPLATLPSRPPP